MNLRHEMALDALGFGTAVAPLLHHYRSGPQVAGLDRKISLEIHLSHEGEAGEVWRAVPRDGEAGFLRVMTRVSVEIQKALRSWVQLLWCADVENLRDTDRTAQVAAYLALRPYFPKAKNAYAYDVLEDSHTRSIARSVGIYMASALEPISTQLRLAGEHDLADFYAPTHAAWFAETALKAPKYLYEMLAREDRMVRVWAPLSGRVAEESEWEEARESVAASLRGIFRREEDWRFLTPMIEIAATAGIENFLDRESACQLALKIRPDPHSVAKTGGKLIAFPQRQPQAADGEKRAA